MFGVKIRYDLVLMFTAIPTTVKEISIMKYIRRSFVILSLMFGFILPFNAQAELPTAVNGAATPSLAPMLKKITPAIVNISVVGQTPRSEGPFALLPRSKRRGADPQANDNKQNNQANNDNNSGDDSNNYSDNSNDDNSAIGPRDKVKKFMSVGSGVIVDAKNGYVITNAHVLQNAKTVSVTLKDGRQFDAELIGADSGSDIAVLQIPADHLQALHLGNSDNLQVGDFVVAIGNPFGLNQTVTSGIVSGLQRNVGIDGLENFIQTDASINPGNSGGALVNLNGQLVGINTAIMTPDGGNIGIGFAVPANMVKSVMTQLIKYGSVHRGLMGIMIQNITPSLAKALGDNKDKGAIVTQVTPDSPAAKAGIKPYDIIDKVDGKRIESANQVTNIVGLVRVGDKIDLGILRNGKHVTVEVTTASPKQYLAASKKQNPLLFGVNLRNFKQLTALHGEVQGVQITGISEKSPAYTASPVGLRIGDVIVSANRKPVHNTKELLAITKQSKQLVLNVYRGTGAMFLVVK